MPRPTTAQPHPWVIVPAAGLGRRFGSSIPKQFMTLAGRSLLSITVSKLRQCSEIKGLVVVLPKDYDPDAGVLPSSELHQPIVYTKGAAQRMDSVRAGFDTLPPQCNLVLIHDAARPNVTPGLMSRIITSAWLHKAAVPAVIPSDTVKKVGRDNRVIETLDRNALRLIQTPQGFRREVLEFAYHWVEQSGANRQEHTDEASLVEASGQQVFTIEGDLDNLKVTTQKDLGRVHTADMGKGFAMVPRVGHGYDVHKLTAGRKLILCGVEIDYHQGLLGHSDADVALHALIDAILGAAGLGDIGRLFPDNEPKYKGISSLKLLEATIDLVKKAGYQTTSIDITIIAQAPRLSMSIPRMQQVVAQTLALSTRDVNIKATTEEGLGFTGTGLGMASHAIAVLVPIS